MKAQDSTPPIFSSLDAINKKIEAYDAGGGAYTPEELNPVLAQARQYAEASNDVLAKALVTLATDKIRSDERLGQPVVLPNEVTKSLATLATKDLRPQIKRVA